MTDETTNIAYPVAERFTSINGEGEHAGRLAAFIRFSGCNLACSYCDTRWACDAECTVAFYTVNELVKWVASQPCACVTLTGGEPLLQPRLSELVAALAELEQIEVVEVETNGSLDLAALASSRPEELRITMDYKLPSSGMEERMELANFAVLAPCDVVKFVAGTPEDLETMARVLAEHQFALVAPSAPEILASGQDLPATEAPDALSVSDATRAPATPAPHDRRFQAYVSPVFGALDPAAIVEFMKEHALVDVTLQLQLHKLIWPSQERGV